MTLSILGYETAFLWIANQLNSLPLCIGSDTEDLENLDLITSNGLLLGRNNLRAMCGRPHFDSYSKIEQEQRDLEKAWQKQWSAARVLKFLPEHCVGPSGKDVIVKPGDICIFTRHGHDDSEEWGAAPWRLGRVIEVDERKLQRSVWLEYSNGSQNGLRRTYRSLRSVVVLHRAEDMDSLAVVNLAAHNADLMLGYWLPSTPT